MQNIFVHPAGQDDNLGDSLLRVGLLNALSGGGRRLHIYLEGQSSDYVESLPIGRDDVLYASRRAWLAACKKSARPVYVLNAGEINPQVGRPYPYPHRAAEIEAVARRNGVVIAAGIGVKDPVSAAKVDFGRSLRDANVVSWRDHGSRDAAGFGDVAPDWAFALGTASSEWAGRQARKYIAVTLRFDRPWPDEEWFESVRSLALLTDTRIVTVAQVARDSPRAVHLAEVLGGEYSVAPSTRHDDLDRHVRAVYSQSLAVVSDRAHALIMGATEGAYPIGTAVDPQKIKRILDTAGVGSLTGHHDGLTNRISELESSLESLGVAVDKARNEVNSLGQRVRLAIQSDEVPVAPVSR